VTNIYNNSDECRWLDAKEDMTGDTKCGKWDGLTSLKVTRNSAIRQSAYNSYKSAVVHHIPR